MFKDQSRQEAWNVFIVFIEMYLSSIYNIFPLVRCRANELQASNSRFHLTCFGILRFEHQREEFLLIIFTNENLEQNQDLIQYLDVDCNLHETLKYWNDIFHLCSDQQRITVII